ncbi:MAG: hypothetical protein LBK08_05230 [Treponema sp.]|nr:hypothetical protein [Treponema sp.]
MKKCFFVLGTLIMVNSFLYSQFVVDGLRLENNLLSPPMGFAPVKGVAVRFSPWSYFDFFVTNDAIFYFGTVNPRPLVIAKNDLVLGENRYYTFELERNYGNMKSERVKYVFIAGGDIIIWEPLKTHFWFYFRFVTFFRFPNSKTSII